MHFKWVSAEMPHLLEPSFPAESLLGLMFPITVATPSARANPVPVMAEAQTTEETTSQVGALAIGMAEATTTTAAEATTPIAEQASGIVNTETAVIPLEESSSVLLQPPSSTRSLAAMSAITLTPPTSYGSRSTPPTSFGSRTTADRSVHTSTTNPSTGEQTMEVIVER